MLKSNRSLYYTIRVSLGGLPTTNSTIKADTQDVFKKKTKHTTNLGWIKPIEGL